MKKKKKKVALIFLPKCSNETQVINKDFQYSTGNYIQYLVITYNERECKKKYMYKWIIVLYTRN